MQIKSSGFGHKKIVWPHGIRLMFIEANAEKHASFAKDGFQFLRGLVTAEDLSLVLNDVALQVQSGKPSAGDGPNS